MKPGDHFRYVAGNKLSLAQPSLLACYLPIIGNDAFVLYQYLQTFTDGGVVAHRFTEILNHLQFGMPVLEKSLMLLEGIGLLKHYTAGEEHILLVQPALEMERFLRQDVLKSLLQQKIGEPAVEDLHHQLSPQAEDVTRGFVQVFGDKGQVLSSADAQDAESFRFDYFKREMERNGLTFTDEANDIIMLYRIAEQESLQWYTLFQLAKATAVANKIEPRRILAQLKANSSSQEGELTAKEQEIIKDARTLSAEEFLEVVKHQLFGGYPYDDEKKLVKSLAIKGFLDEVINVMVLYTFSRTQSGNLNKRYINKLANDFARQNIATAKEAVLKIRELRSSDSKNTAKKGGAQQASSQTTNVPEWSNPDYQNQTTQEELEELEALRRRSLERLDKLGKET